MIDVTDEPMIDTVSIQFESCYGRDSLVRPITPEKIQWLLDHEVFDAQYDESQNGLRGIFESQFDPDRMGDNPIAYLSIALWNGQPVGVATIRRVYDNADIDNMVSIYVKPQFRCKWIGKGLLDRIQLFNAPGMGMILTDSVAPLLSKNGNIFPVRRPTALDFEVTRCLRSLDPKTSWVSLDQAGKPESHLCSLAIAKCITDLHARVRELERGRV